MAASLADYLKSLPLYALPHHALSRGILELTRIQSPFNAAVIRWFVRRYGVDLSEAAESNPGAYEHFNAFFTRALKPGARPVVEAPGAIACPVDGTVSQAGRIAEGRIIQAKGRDYSVYELLGGSKHRAATFADGQFATLYLSPRDYHRIHMPLDARLTEMVHVPGRLFSVAPHTTRVVPRLFARNERVACLFETATGPLAMVLVGAINVAAIETVWAGLVTPPRGRAVNVTRYEVAPAIHLLRGQEMGRFNLGSTVILLFADPSVQWVPGLLPGRAVRMGELLAQKA